MANKLRFRSEGYYNKDYAGRAVSVTKRPNSYLTWTQFRRLAKLTGEMTPKCGFDKQGRCKGSRNSHPTSWLSQPQCCCKDCPGKAGYHDRVSEAQAKVMQSLWDEELGFWREGQGCVLPRKYRSPTCLTFFCDRVRTSTPMVLHNIKSILSDGFGYDEVPPAEPPDFEERMRDLRIGLQKARLIAPPK